MPRLPVVLLAASLIAVPLAAQNKADNQTVQVQGYKGIAPFFAVNFPTTDGVSTGWGAGLQGMMGQGAFALIGEIGYDHFGADDTFDGGVVESRGPLASFSRAQYSSYGSDGAGLWHFAAGLRLAVGPLYVGGLAGYWTEVEDFDVVPLAGIQFKRLDLGVRFKGLLGDGDWIGLVAAYHFGR